MATPFIDFRPAEVRKNKETYILYYVLDPASDKLKRMRGGHSSHRRCCLPRSTALSQCEMEARCNTLSVFTLRNIIAIFFVFSPPPKPLPMNYCRPYRFVHPLRGCVNTRGNAIGYRYVSPNGDGFPVTYSVTHSLTDHSLLITVHSSHTFSAKERDTETGLSYFGARYYSSDLSIWLGVDPMASKYPSLSPYVYCADNPVKLVDIDGCDWVLSTGNKVYWYAGDKGDRSTLLHTYNASSGNYDKDNDYRQAQYQNVRDKGPTPEGEYFINLVPDPERSAKRGKDGNFLRSGVGGIEQLVFEVNGIKCYYPAWGKQRALLQPVKVTGATSAERDNNSYYMHDSEKCFTHGCTEVESGFFEQLKTYRDEGNEKIDVVIEYPNAQHRTTSCKTNSDE